MEKFNRGYTIYGRTRFAEYTKNHNRPSIKGSNNNNNAKGSYFKFLKTACFSCWCCYNNELTIKNIIKIRNKKVLLLKNETINELTYILILQSTGNFQEVGRMERRQTNLKDLAMALLLRMS